MSTPRDSSGLPESLPNLSRISDEELLALAEAFGPADANGTDPESGESARRGLDLVRLAASYWPNSPPTPATGGSDLTGLAAGGLAAGGDGSATAKIAHTETQPSRLGSSIPPARIGRFEILRELGQGGFGVVLLALDPILQRQVALKVPKPDALVSKTARTRFEREARAAAMLSHPAIVPLFETELYGPIQYIAFGFVPGESLAAFLNRHQSLEPHLAAGIVARLAEAVEHAHQRGVVHRDLKPGNVLLAYMDQDKRFSDDELLASLRIADFGLAKFSDSDSAGLTREGALLGTPSYMSPEQARGQDQEVGPSSDTYGLGAILYELLTGRPPFREESDLATLRAVERDPPVSPRRLRALVPRDLEAICLKCLEKMPAQRYASSADLAADLNRWLRGEPIQARSVRAPERLGRWCRRNPALALALGIAFVSLATGLTVALVQQQQLRHQLAEITAQKTRADKETDRAQKSEQATLAALEAARHQRRIAETHFLVSNSVREFLYDDLLGQADPDQQFSSLEKLRALGFDEFQFAANPTINELLRRVLPQLTAKRLEQRFPGQPLVQAELLSTIGGVLLDQQLFTEAIELLQRARDLYRDQDGAIPNQRLRCEFLLARALGYAGDFEQARQLHQTVLDQRMALDSRSPEYFESRLNLAGLEFLKGDRRQSIATYRGILEEARRTLEPDHPVRRRAVNAMSGILINSANAAMAIQILTENYPDLEQIREEARPGELESQMHFAVALLSSGEASRALPLLQSIHQLRESSLGAEHPDTVRSCLPLAQALWKTGATEQAQQLNQVILDQARELFGVQSSLALAATNNLASIHWSRGDYAASIPLFESAVKIASQHYGPQSLDALFYKANLGVNYRDHQQYTQAIAVLQEVVSQVDRFDKLQWVSKELFSAYFRAGQFDQAEQFCRDWQALAAREDPPRLAWSFEAHSCLGRLLLQRGDYAAAETELQAALQLNQEANPRLTENYWPLALTRADLALARLRQDRGGDALPLLESACASLRDRFEAIPSGSRPEILDCFRELAKQYAAEDQPGPAAAWEQTLARLSTSTQKDFP